jgi:hypothetical protein
MLYPTVDRSLKTRLDYLRCAFSTHHRRYLKLRRCRSWSSSSGGRARFRLSRPYRQIAAPMFDEDRYGMILVPRWSAHSQQQGRHRSRKSGSVLRSRAGSALSTLAGSCSDSSKFKALHLSLSNDGKITSPLRRKP